MQEQYDVDYVCKVYSKPLLVLPQVLAHHQPEEKTVRVEYTDKDGFKKQAKLLGIMDDLKVRQLGLLSHVVAKPRPFLI